MLLQMAGFPSFFRAEWYSTVCADTVYRPYFLYRSTGFSARSWKVTQNTPHSHEVGEKDGVPLWSPQEVGEKQAEGMGSGGHPEALSCKRVGAEVTHPWRCPLSLGVTSLSRRFLLIFPNKTQFIIILKTDLQKEPSAEELLRPGMMDGCISTLQLYIYQIKPAARDT